MFCTKEYLTKLLKITESEDLYLTCKDIEFENVNSNIYYEDKFYNNTLKLSFTIILPLTFFIVYTTIINKLVTGINYFLIMGIIFEIILSKLSYNLKERHRIFRLMKIFRFFLCYSNISINSIFSQSIVEENLVRFSFIFILYVNISQFLFLELNVKIQVLLPILNSLVLISLQISRNKSILSLFPEIIINYVSFYASYMIKKYKLLDKKRGYCESLQAQLYYDYIKNLIDVIECMIVGIKNKEILFMNNFAFNFLKKILLLNNENYNQRGDNKENEIILIHQIKSEPERFFNLFFQSLFLLKSFDKNFKEGISFKEVIEEVSQNDSYLSLNFNKIGYFCSDIGHELLLEVYVRKLKYSEEAIEILVYNVSDVKKAEKEAVESSIKNKILAKIAHELKTPLLTIISLINKINLYLNNDYNQECKVNLQYIYSLSGYTIILINDIIQYASNFSNLRLNFHQTNLREVLEFSFNILNTFIECNENKSDKIKTFLEYDINIDLKNITTDELRIKQIILNFISNAYKFTFSGFIKLKAQYLEDLDIIEISVKDSGIGIKKENQSMIFKEKVQLNFDKEYNSQGTGLGLSISKNLANILNYEIGFTSEYEVGSTFYLRIKCNENSESNGKRTTNFFRKNTKTEGKNGIMLSNIDKKTHRSVMQITSSKKLIFSNIIGEDTELTKRIGREEFLRCEDLEIFESQENLIECDSPISTINNNFKILVVDDHKFVRENTINIVNSCLKELEYSNYEVVEYSDGLDILNAVRYDKDKRIKLILTDENMEYLNGSEAVKILRGLEENKKINYYPIISITAFDDKISKNRILSSGVNTILSKPCTKSTINNILIKFLTSTN